MFIAVATTVESVFRIQGGHKLSLIWMRQTDSSVHLWVYQGNQVSGILSTDILWLEHNKTQMGHRLLLFHRIPNIIYDRSCPLRSASYPFYSAPLSVPGVVVTLEAQVAWCSATEIVTVMKRH